MKGEMKKDNRVTKDQQGFWSSMMLRCTYSPGEDKLKILFHLFLSLLKRKDLVPSTWETDIYEKEHNSLGHCIFSKSAHHSALILSALNPFIPLFPKLFLCFPSYSFVFPSYSFVFKVIPLFPKKLKIKKLVLTAIYLIRLMEDPPL
jgi:hypothetical protein